MAFAFGFGPVLIRGAGVQDLVVVQKLDIAGLEIHIEADVVVVCQMIHKVHGFDLLR